MTTPESTGPLRPWRQSILLALAIGGGALVVGAAVAVVLL